MAKHEKVTRENSAIQYVAALVPALAALPAAYFVGRSTYYYLILRWFEDHVLFWPVLGVVVAVIAGLVVEGLGTVSLFLWSSFRRWNRVKAVREDGTVKRGYDLAPEGLALVALAGYVVAVVVLLVLLEWQPESARFAPVMFPVLTVVGGLCWAMYDQHRDRLAYHGLSWNWVVVQYAGETEPGNVQNAVQNVQNEGQDSSAASHTAVELDSTDRAIMRTYRDNPAASYQTVGKTVELSKSAVSNRVRSKLAPAGLVERTGDQWTVHWSDNGKNV